MFALVQDGSITKHLNGNRGITLNNIQYPKSIFTLWSEAERNAIGIYEVTVDTTNKKDEQWYTNTNVSSADKINMLGEAVSELAFRNIKLWHCEDEVRRTDLVDS